MWTIFSKIRTERLPRLWAGFLLELGCGSVTNILFTELINDVLMENLIHSIHVPAGNNNTCTTESSSRVEITKDEESIIRYACGYVGMKLQKRFTKLKGERAAIFVDCLDQMCADGPSSSLFDYSREWIDRVNRGGLFDVSNDAYVLFYVIEEAMRERLTTHISKSGLLTPTKSAAEKERIIDFVVKDMDVQYRWDVISSDMDEDMQLELLTHIVSLWLTIRGFSISKSWMEDYKVKEATNTKKKKSLRKELSRKGESTTQA